MDSGPYPAVDINDSEEENEQDEIEWEANKRALDSEANICRAVIEAMCYSYGFYVPIWHTSKSCPPQCRKATYRKEVDRNNARSYKDAGHNVCMRGVGKTQLPQSPVERQT